MNSVDASRNFGTAVSACDPYFAAIEPFTKRANHRYNIRNRHTCPASDAVHQEVAGYKDREDFEAYNEGYLDAHTAAIEALALAFEKLVDAFEGLQNGGSSYSTATELFKSSLDLYEFNALAYGRAAECASRDALEAQLKDARNTLAAIESLEAKGAYTEAGTVVDAAEGREARGRQFEEKAQDAESTTKNILTKIESAKIKAEKAGGRIDAGVLTEEKIKAQAAAVTKQMMAKFGTPEFEAGIATSWTSENAGVTHEEFAQKVPQKKMGVKFLIRPSKLLTGIRQLLFSSMVCGYFIVPWIACPLWAWHEGKWWLAFGALVSKGATKTAAKEKEPVVLQGIILLLVALGLAAWLGIHSQWTYFVFCAGWGMYLFAKADQFESAAALETLVERKDVFDRMASTGQIMIVRR